MKKTFFFLLIIIFHQNFFALESFGIDNFEKDIYRTALELQDKSNYKDALKEIEKIPDPENNYNVWILQIKLLFENKQYGKLIEKIKKSKKFFLKKGINNISYEIIVSYANLHKLKDLEIIVSEIGPSKVKQSVGILLVKYLKEKDYDKYIDVITKLQNIIFSNDEQKLLKSVYFYYLNDFKRASAGFLNLRKKSGDIKDIAEYYLSLIQFYSSENILTFDEDLSDRVKENLIIKEVKENNFEHLFRIKKNNDVLYHNLLAYNNFHKKKYRESYQNLKFSENPFYYFLLAENERKLREYKIALKHYKYLKKKKMTNKDYLNYAIGSCYYQLYRYNNSAYYWMKLLYSKDEKYRFAGLYRLSKLYTFTKHYEYAIPYYQALLDKYSYQNKIYVRAFFKVILKEERADLLKSYYFKFKKLLDRKLKEEITLYLGQNSEKNNNLTDAIRFYKEFLMLKRDDEIEFKVSYLEYKSRENESYEIFLRNFIFTHPENSLNKRFSRDLLKFYLKKNDYHEAIKTINYLDSISVKIDSLNYFKALAFNGLKKWQSSAEILYKIVKKDTVFTSNLELYEYTLKNMKPQKSINFISTKLDSTDNQFLRKRQIMLLSEIYDKNRLFGEAIENYHSVLEDTSFTLTKKEVYEIKIKLVTDYLILKKYKKSVEILSEIEKSFGKTAESDYLSFVAFAALKDKKMQKKYLLDYFLNYPNGDEFDVVAIKLADIYCKEDRKLLAWVIYKKLKNLKSDDYKILKKMDILKKELQVIKNDSLLYYQVQPIKNAFFWN